MAGDLLVFLLRLNLLLLLHHWRNLLCRIRGGERRRESLSANGPEGDMYRRASQ
jgi:hypothetical protein